MENDYLTKGGKGEHEDNDHTFEVALLVRTAMYHSGAAARLLSKM